MPSDYESAVDNIQRELKRADKSLWRCAGHAERAGVGEWQDGITNDLATLVGKSPVTVRLWVRARRLFRELYTVKRQSTIVWRRELSISHFAKMRTLQAKYNLSYDFIEETFNVMLQYKKNCDSYAVATMEREVEAAMADDKTLPTWSGYHHRRAVDYVVTLLSLPDLPRSWRKWANKAPEKERFVK